MALKSKDGLGNQPHHPKGRVLKDGQRRVVTTETKRKGERDEQDKGELRWEREKE